MDTQPGDCEVARGCPMPLIAPGQWGHCRPGIHNTARVLEHEERIAAQSSGIRSTTGVSASLPAKP